MEEITPDKSAAGQGHGPGAIVIAGPTASGKSALALDLAIDLEGIVINADSMQAYRDLPILTAQPGPADLACAPHRLYGFLESDATLSAAAWAGMARREIAMALEAGRVPIVVGGSGLYLRALTEGLSPIPPIPNPIRDEARALLRAMGSQALHSRLAEVDPLRAGQLHPNDRQRITRAWEVYAATGIPLSRWQGRAGEGLASHRYIGVLCLPTRPLLHEAIDRRVVAMVEAGALAEVAKVTALLPEAAWIGAAGRTLGFTELARHLAGAMALGDAVAAVQKRTRRYAKRQMTWVRHQIEFSNIISIETPMPQFSDHERHQIRQKIRNFLLTA